MIQIRKATPTDAETLTAVSKACFDDDSQHYLGVESGGPPGYDSVQWQRKLIRVCDYFKVIKDNRVIGGLIVDRKGPGHYEVARIFLDPDYHNRGIGTDVMLFVEREYPLATRLTLDTPTWATRNHHFYEKLSYVRVKSHDSNLVYYEKRLTRHQTD